VADVIIVCDKLDTGFNEPAVMAIYIDRPLAAASRIVQLLSRANRNHPMKPCVHILDFVNHPLHVIEYHMKYDNEPSCSS
jgi:type I restriction enzyme R subunit